MSTQVGNIGGTPVRGASSSATLLKSARKIHLYFGLFIAPALLFFAFTGAMQTLSLHEAAGSSYAPPGWLARLGQLHKNQNIALRKTRPQSPEGSSNLKKNSALGPPTATSAPPRPPVTLAAKQKQHLPEKIFFLLVSLGLFTSTLTGIFMAYKYERGKLLVTALLIAGVVIPLALLPF